MNGIDGAPRGLAWVWIAGALGLAHAGFSAFWALGGTWLLDTVGQAAMELHAESPVRVGLGLGMVALAKAAAAVVPIAVAHGLLPGAGLWRAISWVGAAFLVLYGGVNTVVANLVLGGAIAPGDEFDRAGMRGHAWLWDPLFLLWGAALLVHLILSRRARQVSPRPA